MPIVARALSADLPSVWIRLLSCELIPSAKGCSMLFE